MKRILPDISLFFVILFAVLLSLGNTQALENESFYLNEALVHHVSPDESTKDFAVIMVPGHNLSSYIYLTTPDGREGWAQQVAHAGYEVYVINDPKFDFSHGFPVAEFATVPTEGRPAANPNATRPWGQDIWRRWGFGTSRGNPYVDSKFPSDQFGEFENGYPWLSSGSSTSFAAAIAELLKDVGPAVLIAHSAGGPQAVNAASVHPDKVAALVLVEPTGPPTEQDFPDLAGLSMLGVYADYIESRNQTNRKNATIAAAALFEENGGVGEIIDLPEDYGINGNSHIMMQGTNNGFISDLMIEWLNENAKVSDNPGGGGGGGGGKGKGRGRGGKGGGKGKGGRGGSMMTQIVSELDADKDGALDENEFRKGRRFQNADAAEAREAFRRADSNRDGKVTPEELAESVSRGRRGE